MERLKAAHLNRCHFAKLAEYAESISALQLVDEAHYAPLADLETFQRELHQQATIARRAREMLLVYGLHSKRRSTRKNR